MPSRLDPGSRWLLGAAVGVAALIVWQVFFSQSTPVGAVTAPAQTGASGANAPFVRSMQGTLPDGDLLALQGGQSAIPSGSLAYGELRRLFDYYLSAVGEQSIEAITQHIHAELGRRLPAQQAKKAQRLLALYIEFKRELVELDGKPSLSGNGVAAIRARMLAMQDLRARYFSNEETQGMFGFEDAYDMDAVARLEVSQNPALSALEKQQQLAALDAAMPANLRAERDASTVVVRVEQKAQELRAKGASEDDIYRMRAKEFDASAASRLAEVDREEAAWKSRIASYLEERSKLLKASANATESERQASLAQLQQSAFSEAERPRLRAYE
jgi:lipase chaperone LimK